MRRGADHERSRARGRRGGLVLGLVLGCAAEPEVVDLVLVDDPSCTAPVIDGLASLSVEVYGDAGGQLCTLARRCVTVDGASSVADLEVILADAAQPLVDVELDGVRQIAILGHSRLGCGEGDRRLCGFADLADLEGGALALPLRCEDAIEPERCPLEVPPFCP